MELPVGNQVFIDTTALYALLDRTHEAHDRVVAAWNELLRSSVALITSSYVCAELRALVQARLGLDSMRAFLDEVRPHMTVLAVDSEDHARSLAHSKRDLSTLVPRTSGALMRRLGVTTVLALDGQFGGWHVRKVDVGQRTTQSPAEHGRGPSSRSAKAPRRHGARRGRPQPASTRARRTAHPRLPSPPARPELICRKRSGSWQWEVILSATDKCKVAGVRHHDTALRAERGEYCLSSFAGTLSVDHADGTATRVELCTAQAPMIFKFADRWRGVGRKIDAISRGHFIVIAPAGWNRRGHVPVEPEACVDPAFQAHYFHRDVDPTEEHVGFEESDLALTGAGFSLIGDYLYDDSTAGTLFIGSPPELRPGRGVTWARIGEERDGGWRGENFRPAEQSVADVLDHRQGRFFVRVYDSAMKLCDSGEFRYVERLCAFLVDGKPYTRETLLAPSSAGHAPTTVQFVGAEDAAIRPSLKPGMRHRWVEEEAAMVVEPHPDADEVACSLETPSGGVEVFIRLPRIWWYLGHNGEDSAAWCAAPLAMTRDEFRDRANSDCMFHIRVPPEIKVMDVGFDDDDVRRYSPTLIGDGIRCTRIPLSDFVDDSQIDNWLEEDALLYARCGSSVVSLVRVMADAVPEITSFAAYPAVVMRGKQVALQWKTRNARSGSVSIGPEIGDVPPVGKLSVATHETMKYELSIAVSGSAPVTQYAEVTVISPLKLSQLRAYVKHTYGFSIRPCRGFSIREINAAGLTADAAKLVGIPVDCRRHTAHGFNIKALRGCICASSRTH